MKKSTQYLFSSIILVIIIGFTSNIVSIANASMCVRLNSDISSGQTDSVSSGPIKMLQNYLQVNGFFSSNPNGHFGPATLSAVKALQAHAGITATGLVGPKTRAYVSQQTCNTTTIVNIPITNTSVTNTTPTSTSVSTTAAAVSNTNVTSPVTGQVLSTGSTTIIRWINTPLNGFNLTLEQPGGAGIGFIASNLYPGTNGNQYVWRVGQIYSSQTNSNQTIGPGTYRIRIQNPSDGLGSKDQTSGWFTVLGGQLSVSSVVPSSAYADNTSSVVVIGTGFTAATSVYFDSNYSSLRAESTYVSPDGTVVVFTVPTTVPVGTHTLFINNGQSSTPVTQTFTVNSIN